MRYAPTTGNGRVRTHFILDLLDLFNCMLLEQQLASSVERCRCCRLTGSRHGGDR